MPPTGSPRKSVISPSMKRLGLICNSLPATLFLALAGSLSGGLHAQDVLNALPPPPKAVAAEPPPARENDVAIPAAAEDPAEPEQPMRKEQAGGPMKAGRKG